MEKRQLIVQRAMLQRKASAMKRPAAKAQSGASKPKQSKTQGGANESRAVESHQTGVPCNASNEDASIHDLFLAAKESQSHCGQEFQTVKDVDFCEQVYNLKRFPRELKSTGSMAFDTERKSEDNLRQRIKKRLPHMSNVCQAYLSAMKNMQTGDRGSAIEPAPYSSASASSLKRRKIKTATKSSAAEAEEQTADEAVFDAAGGVKEPTEPSRTGPSDSHKQMELVALFRQAMEHANAKQKLDLEEVHELQHHLKIASPCMRH